MNRVFLREFTHSFFRLCLRGDLPAFRLAWKALWGKRNAPGTCRLPCGTISYLDALVLYYQYKEIIRDGCYDFICTDPNPRILDCGGNIGISVIRFKTLYPGAHITVFEADPAIVATLKQNLHACNISDVIVHSEAVGIVNGTTIFKSNGLDSGHVTADKTAGGKSIPCIRLADQIIETTAFLKLDIEGSEYSVISDLVSSGAIQFVQRMAVELHASSTKSEQVAQVLFQLGKAGFSITLGFARSAPELPGQVEKTPFSRLVDGRHLLHLYAWRPEMQITNPGLN
jgi:FkbM family methyltransferase